MTETYNNKEENLTALAIERKKVKKKKSLSDADQTN